MNRKITGMRLFVTIVDRNMGNRVVKLFEEVGSHYHQIMVKEQHQKKYMII